MSKGHDTKTTSKVYTDQKYVPCSLRPLDLTKPKKPKKKGARHKFLPPERFAVIDIEARDWDQLVMVGLFDGEVFEWHRTMGEALKSLFSRGEDMSVYAHFGGGYDMKFILQEIFQPADGNPTPYHVENMIPIGISCTFLQFDTFQRVSEYPKITFVDSFRFLPMALKKINECFKTKHIKLDYDVSEITEDNIDEKLIEYNENDCRSLYEAIEIYRNHDLVRGVGFRHTVGSQAMAIFRSYLKDPINPCYKFRDQRPKETLREYQQAIFKVDWFIRGAKLPAVTNREGQVVEPAVDIAPCYFGGRTEVFNMWFDGPGTLNYYDVNSLYPSVMLGNVFPHEYIGQAKKFYPNQLGFWDVEVEIPTPDQDSRFWIPPLGVCMKTTSSDKFIFPCGHVRGKWNTAELNYAMSLGVKIKKVHRGYIFSSAGELFTEFVTTIYKKRLSAKKAGDEVTATICKLILNSCYGRFGINPWREQLDFFTWKEGERPLEHWFQTPEGMKQMAKYETLVGVFSNVAIASYVTAYARILLHKALLNTNGSIWYCDTDSLVTAQKLPTSDALGHLKLEGEVVTGSWILPKGYSMIFKEPMDGKIKQTKIKGMDKKRLEAYDPIDLSENAKGMYDLKLYEVTGASKKFVDAMRRRVKEISTLVADDDGKGKGLKGLTRALSEDHKFAVRDDPMYRRVQSLYDKRKVLQNEKGELTTTPWILDGEGNIANGYANGERKSQKSANDQEANRLSRLG